MNYITDVPCPYATGNHADSVSCKMPVEIVSIRFCHSSDESGHACVIRYRCLSGHRWMKDLPPDHIDQELSEMFS